MGAAQTRPRRAASRRGVGKKSRLKRPSPIKREGGVSLPPIVRGELTTSTSCARVTPTKQMRRSSSKSVSGWSGGNTPSEAPNRNTMRLWRPFALWTVAKHTRAGAGSERKRCRVSRWTAKHSKEGKRWSFYGTGQLGWIVTRRVAACAQQAICQIAKHSGRLPPPQLAQCAQILKKRRDTTLDTLATCRAGRFC